MTRQLEIRRHADDDGEDRLTPAGVRDAVALGRDGGVGGWAVVATSGAQRATQTAACILAGRGEPVDRGVTVVPGLRSAREDEWRAAYRAAGSGELAAMREVAPSLVAEDGAVLADALRTVLSTLVEGESALVVGHSPTNEAAVLALTGELVGPLARLQGVVVACDDDGGTSVRPAAGG